MVIMVTLQFLFTWQLVIMKIYMHERVRLSTMCYCSLMVCKFATFRNGKIVTQLIIMFLPSSDFIVGMSFCSPI